MNDEKKIKEESVKPIVRTPRSDNSERRFVRPTGIAELDFMLKGGLPTDSTVLLAGASGTGKTILAMQWLFAGYDQFKEPGLYISLTEPVSKAMKNIHAMSFFKKEYINPTQVYFTDLRGIIKGLDLEGKDFTREDIMTVVDAVGNMVKQSGAKRVVIDSVTAMAYRLKDRDLIRDFIFQLGTFLSQTDANVVMTSEVVGDGYSVFGVEEFISDGIIKLSHTRAGEELVRNFEIVKMRGIDYDSHPAIFRISKDGIHLFPRLSRVLSYEVSDTRIPTGIPGLDEMTNGGLFVGSSVLLTGASGTGKTLMSLQFIVDGALRGEKGLYVSFEESRDQLVRNAFSFGWDLDNLEKEGSLKIITSYPEEKYLEEHIEIIKSAVEDFGAKNVVVDSLSSLANVFSNEILRDFGTRLVAHLKAKQVTAVFTVASGSIMGLGSITESGLSTMTDHIIMLRYVEIQSELHHAILILKMRGSGHDKKMRKLQFGASGVSISSEFKGYEGVLSGATRKIGNTTEEQLRALFLEVLGPMGEEIFAEEQEKGLTLESVKKLIGELGNQGIISERRKEEFAGRIGIILGEKKEETGKTAAEPQKAAPMDLDDFLHLGDKK